MVGGEDLEGVVPAAVQVPDVLVGVVGHHRPQLRRVEEVLADVGAVPGLVGLVVAVHRLHHPALQGAGLVARQQRVPVASPDHLDDVPPGAAELALQLLDDLPVAAHRAVEPLEVGVHDEDQVVELLAPGHADGAHGLRLVHLAVARQRPDLAARGLREAAVVQVLHEPGLVDGHEGPEPHRHRGEVPEPRHEPRVGVGGEPLAVHLLPEVVELVLGEEPEQEGAGVDARRRVALDEDQVAALVLPGRAPEVVVPDVVEHRPRREAGDVAAHVGVAVGADHHRHGVPADDVPDALLELEVARERRLPLDRDGVHVGGAGREGQVGAGAAGPVDELLDDPVGAVRPLPRDDALEGVEPLSGLLRVHVGRAVHRCSSAGCPGELTGTPAGSMVAADGDIAPDPDLGKAQPAAERIAVIQPLQRLSRPSNMTTS